MEKMQNTILKLFLCLLLILWFHLDNYPSAHVILHIPDGILLNKRIDIKLLFKVPFYAKLILIKNLIKMYVCYAPIKHVHLTDIPGRLPSLKKTILI